MVLLPQKLHFEGCPVDLSIGFNLRVLKADDVEPELLLFCQLWKLDLFERLEPRHGFPLPL